MRRGTKYRPQQVVYHLRQIEVAVANGKTTAQEAGIVEQTYSDGEGDTIVCHAIDRLARNLDDLRKLVLELVKRSVMSASSKRT